MSDHGDRIDELEARLAFHEELVQQLNDALGAQQIQLQELHSAVRILAQRMKETQACAVASGAPADERPPHY